MRNQLRKCPPHHTTTLCNVHTSPPPSKSLASGLADKQWSYIIVITTNAASQNNRRQGDITVQGSSCRRPLAQICQSAITIIKAGSPRRVLPTPRSAEERQLNSWFSLGLLRPLSSRTAVNFRNVLFLVGLVWCSMKSMQ